MLMMVLKVRYRINQIIGVGRNNLSKLRTHDRRARGRHTRRHMHLLAAVALLLARLPRQVAVSPPRFDLAYAWASSSSPEMPSDCANALNSLAEISLTTSLVSGLIS